MVSQRDDGPFPVEQNVVNQAGDIFVQLGAWDPSDQCFTDLDPLFIEDFFTNPMNYAINVTWAEGVDPRNLSGTFISIF